MASSFSGPKERCWLTAADSPVAGGEPRGRSSRDFDDSRRYLSATLSARDPHVLNFLGCVRSRQKPHSDMTLADHNHNFELPGRRGGCVAPPTKIWSKCKWTASGLLSRAKIPWSIFISTRARFVMFHIKDLKPGYGPTTDGFKGNPFAELGNGVSNWKKIFAAAPEADVKHYYVEQVSLPGTQS